MQDNKKKLIKNINEPETIYGTPLEFLRLCLVFYEIRVIKVVRYLRKK